MQRTSSIRAMTLLEVMIANTILAMLIVFAMDSLNSTVRSVMAVQAEVDAQMAAHSVVSGIYTALQEAGQERVTLFRYPCTGDLVRPDASRDTNATQVALSMAWARRENNGGYACTQGTEPTSDPQYQGVAVYAVWQNQLVRYVDYRPRTEAEFSRDLIRITTITNDQIRLADGTRFWRDPTRARPNSQMVVGVGSDIARLEVLGTVIDLDDSGDPTGVRFDLGSTADFPVGSGFNHEDLDMFIIQVTLLDRSNIEEIARNNIPMIRDAFVPVRMRNLAEAPPL